MAECNFCLRAMDSPLTVTTEKNASTVPVAVVTKRAVLRLACPSHFTHRKKKLLFSDIVKTI